MNNMIDYKEKNIALIGMCGSGKSTVGVLLAKEMGRYYLDTDVYIQAVENKSLQQLIDEFGIAEFCQIEEKQLICIDLKNAVLATGGSVVYSPNIMKHLGHTSVIIHLDIDYGTIEKRVTNLYTRGVVMEKGQTLESLYQKRQPLYQKYAQITIDCNNKTQDKIVSEIIDVLNS
jgi:shikimate kinase